MFQPCNKDGRKETVFSLLLLFTACTLFHSEIVVKLHNYPHHPPGASVRLLKDGNLQQRDGVGKWQEKCSLANVAASVKSHDSEPSSGIKKKINKQQQKVIDTFLRIKYAYKTPMLT